MIDWTKSMQQTFEYFTVDPYTWKDKEKLSCVISSSITRDSTVNTLGSATIDVVDVVGEEYIRIYLKVIQNGYQERIPLGTYLAQTPNSKFNGKTRHVTIDAYTPLLELNETMPPLGYSIPKQTNIMDMVYKLTTENMRAPVVNTSSTTKLYYDFIANTDDTWLTFIKDLMVNDKYKFDLDELGRVLFQPEQDVLSLQPIWTYTDDNSSILYPDIDTEHDIYGIPNVVEVIYSNDQDMLYSKVENTDSNSPLSIPNRGRRIVYRDTNPSIIGNATQPEIDKYAENLLRELSSVEFKITYTHGYCPVRIGDCVRLNYKKAGLSDIKAKVISQTIKCEPGCPVTEKAIVTNNLWG